MSDDRPLRVAAQAHGPQTVTIWTAMRRYFNDHGLAMDYALYSTYDAMCRALLAGEVDIAWNAPMAHAQSLMQSGGACRTLAMRDTDQNVATVIVARTDSGIAALQDLRGKRLALGNPLSTELRIIPVRQLAQAGLDLERECEIVNLGPREYPDGERWVDSGIIFEAITRERVDAGAIFEPFLNHLAKTATRAAVDFKIVWRSKPFCHCAFTARPGLPQGTANRFVELLTAMEPAEPEIAEMMELEHFRRWLPADDSGWVELVAALEERNLTGVTF